MIHLVFFIPLCVFEFLYSYEDTEMKGWDFTVVPFPAQPRDGFVGGMVLGLVGAEETLLSQFGELTCVFLGCFIGL